MTRELKRRIEEIKNRMSTKEKLQKKLRQKQEAQKLKDKEESGPEPGGGNPASAASSGAALAPPIPVDATATDVVPPIAAEASYAQTPISVENEAGAEEGIEETLTDVEAALERLEKKDAMEDTSPANPSPAVEPSLEPAGESTGPIQAPTDPIEATGASGGVNPVPGSAPDLRGRGNRDQEDTPGDDAERSRSPRTSVSRVERPIKPIHYEVQLMIIVRHIAGHHCPWALNFWEMPNSPLAVRRIVQQNKDSPHLYHTIPSIALHTDNPVMLYGCYLIFCLMDYCELLITFHHEGRKYNEHPATSFLRYCNISRNKNPTLGMDSRIGIGKDLENVREALRELCIEKNIPTPEIADLTPGDGSYYTGLPNLPETGTLTRDAGEEPADDEAMTDQGNTELKQMLDIFGNGINLEQTDEYLKTSHVQGLKQMKQNADRMNEFSMQILSLLREAPTKEELRPRIKMIEGGWVTIADLIEKLNASRIMQHKWTKGDLLAMIRHTNRDSVTAYPLILCRFGEGDEAMEMMGHTAGSAEAVAIAATLFRKNENSKNGVITHVRAGHFVTRLDEHDRIYNSSDYIHLSPRKLREIRGSVDAGKVPSTKVPNS